MDIVTKLRELRHMRGLRQKDVAHLSGLGEKTISSFETGHRIGSLKLAQLRRLLGVYGLSEAEFFSGYVEKEVAPWALDRDLAATVHLIENLHALPKRAQRALVNRFQHMVDAVSDMQPQSQSKAQLGPQLKSPLKSQLGSQLGPQLGPQSKPLLPPESNPVWQVLNSRN